MPPYEKCNFFDGKNNYGRIINFGSAGSGRVTIRKMASSYYAAKTGLYIVSKALSSECIKQGITINMISPGMFETSAVKPKKESMPAGRYAEFKGIINAVMFFLSEKSDCISGSNLEIQENGGLEEHEKQYNRKYPIMSIFI